MNGIEESEFGKGLTICLVKFAAHFMNNQISKLSLLDKYIESDEETRKRMIEEQPAPKFNYGKMSEMLRFQVNDLVPIHGSPEQLMSAEISIWMSGASDHLYDIEVPEGKDWDEIREKVDKVIQKAFAIRNDWGKEKLFTLKDIDDLQQRTFEICVLIDKKLGLKKAEVGKWQ